MIYWPVKKGHCRFANQIERKFQTHFRLFVVSVGGQNKDFGAALQTLLTGVKLRLRRRLENPRLGFRIPGTGFQSLSVELPFCIPIVSEILDFSSCIPDSKAQYSGFHKQILKLLWKRRNTKRFHNYSWRLWFLICVAITTFCDYHRQTLNRASKARFKRRATAVPSTLARQ